MFDAVSTKSATVHPWLLSPEPRAVAKGAKQNVAEAKPHCHALRGKHLFVGGMLA